MTTVASDPELAGGRGVLPPAGATTRLSPPWTRNRIIMLLIAVGGVAGTIWGLIRVDLSIPALIDGWPETRNLLERMLPPTIPAEDRGTITRAVVDTFFMAYAGTAIGVIVAIPLAFLAAENVVGFKPVRAVARAIIVFTRAVPAIVFAMVFVRVYGIGVLPGILALGIHAVGMIGKLLADAIENIDPGPREGVIATGAGRFQELSTGIWSQLVPSVIAITLYRLEIDFRSAPILGFVGAGGIGIIIRGYQGNLRYPELLGVTLLIIVLVVVMEALSGITRRAILGSEGGGETLRSSSVVTGHTGLSAPWTRDRIKLTLAFWGSIGLLVLSFLATDISATEFFASLSEMPDIFWRLVPKDMEWLTSRVISDLVETVAIGFASTALALMVAVPLSFFAAANTSPNGFVYRASRFSALLLRAAPDLVIAVIFVAAIGLGPAAGTLAMAIGLVGFATRLLADNIEEVGDGPREGVRSSGASRMQDVGTAVIPQAAPSMVGNMLYLFDISLRSSTVLGIVGAGGIGFLMNNAAKTLRFDVLGGIVFCIFVVVYAIELLSSWLRRQII